MPTSLHFRILTAVHAEVIGLALDGIDEAKIVLRKVLTDRDLVPPCIVVCPTETEKLTPLDTEKWGVQYPTLVAIISPGNQNLTLSEPELKWRELILEMFRDNYKLEGVDEVWHAHTEPKAIVDLSLFREQNICVGAICFWWETEKTRPGKGQ